MVWWVCRRDDEKTIEPIPVSNDTIIQQIKNMCDIKDQMIAVIKMCWEFSLQLDASTDVSDDVKLIDYIRHQGPQAMKEQFLFCWPLDTSTIGIAVLVSFVSFVVEWKWKIHLWWLFTVSFNVKILLLRGCQVSCRKWCRSFRSLISLKLGL